MIIQLHEEKKKIWSNCPEKWPLAAVGRTMKHCIALWKELPTISVHLKINELFEKDRDFYRRGGGGFNTIFLSLIFIEMKFYSLRSFGVIKKRLLLKNDYYFLSSLFFLLFLNFLLSRFFSSVSISRFPSKTVASWK